MSKEAPIPNERLEFNRRRFIGYFSSVGLGSTLMPGALTAVAQEKDEITVEMIGAAAHIAGLSFTPEELNRVAERLNGRFGYRRSFETLREQEIPNSLPPAIVFNPMLPGMKLPQGANSINMSRPDLSLPGSEEDLAFLPVSHLGTLIASRQITSTDLTKIYLSRLKRLDPKLHCVVTLTEELALKQATQADEEIAAGHYKGRLHGIPWGAKDLLAVKGYRTTWGASPYREQVIGTDSTVFRKLTEGGAVLVAKLSMGALAQGDRWFGGKTRNPWNTDEGSSGSSAGSGAATAAGLVGFSIGTETRGSIISPSTRCGVTGLRPTFGRVSRYGAMALSWTMDKIGPMCRSAEDCGLVLHAINGKDELDNASLDVPFRWDSREGVSKLRVGYVKSDSESEIENDTEDAERSRSQREQRVRDLEALRVLRSLGVQLRPIEIPDLPDRALGFILTTESAAAFDALTRSEQDDLLNAEPETSNWPDAFRLHRFVPAVEYLQANRVRYRLMEQFNQVFNDIDVFVGSRLSLTNLTGHPEICMPHGFRSNGSPTSLRFTGKLFGEAELLTLAKAYQDATDFHRRRPKV